MKAPKLELAIVASTSKPGFVSWRVLDESGHLSVRDIQRQLTDAGFKPGDVVVVTLATEDTTAVIARR